MHTLLDPAILFFVFGVLAGMLRSNLQIPAPISRFLSLYLLMALGLKGGFALAHSGLTLEVAGTLGIAVLLAIVVPLLGYPLLRRLLNGYDATALAATPCELWIFDYHLDAGDDGVSLHARLAEGFGAPPCLILSADQTGAVRMAAQEAGLPLLMKPLRPLALKSVLDRMLAARAVG